MIEFALGLVEYAGPMIAAALTVPILQGIKAAVTYIDRAPAILKQSLAVCVAYSLTELGSLLQVALPTDLAVFTGSDVEGLLSAAVAMAIHAGKKASEGGPTKPKLLSVLAPVTLSPAGIFALLLLVQPLSAQSVELTATDQGYYHVMVEGALFSRHVQEREAAESAISVKLADPSLGVRYTHPYSVAVEVDLPDSIGSGTTTTDTVTVMSDGGEDLVGFLERIQGGPVEATFLDHGTFAANLQAFAESTKDGWLIERLYGEHPDGTTEWIGIGWRGYVLLWVWRDPNAIRINVGGG